MNAANMQRLRAKFAAGESLPKPDSIDGRQWAIFLAYCQGLSARAIGDTEGLSASRVLRLVHDVDAQLEAVSLAAAAPITLDSPLERLPLSSRSRNSLHRSGCKSVQDILQLNLSGAKRFGPKTRQEVLAVLRDSGISHESLKPAEDPEIRSLHRSLDRIHNRLDATLGSVAREIAALQKRLRKRTSQRNGDTPLSSPTGR